MTQNSSNEIDAISGERFVDIKNSMWSFYRTKTEFVKSDVYMPLAVSSKVESFLLKDLPSKLFELDPRFDCIIVKAGSTSEGVPLFRAYSDYEVVEHEFDMLFVIKSLEIDGENVLCLESSETNDSDTFPNIQSCHALICLCNDQRQIWNDCLYESTQNSGLIYSRTEQLRDFLSPRKIINVFENVLIKAFEKTDLWSENVCRVERNGPAITLVMDFKIWGVENTYSFDFVLAIKSECWSSDAKDWTSRNRRWPSREVIKDIQEHGVYFVPKSSSPENEEFEWRVSFSYGEQKLMSLLYQRNQGVQKQTDAVIERTVTSLLDTKCRVECFRILKYLIKKHVSSPKLLTSYHLKTVLLWNLERLPEDYWSRQNMVHCILGLLDDLIFRVSERDLPQFFVPRSNLLFKFETDFIDIVVKKLVNIRRNIRSFFPGPVDFHGIPIHVSYSDTFVEDSEKFQIDTIQKWAVAGSTYDSQPSQSDRKKLFSYSFSFTQKGLDNTRKENTYMRKSSQDNK